MFGVYFRPGLNILLTLYKGICSVFVISNSDVDILIVQTDVGLS